MAATANERLDHRVADLESGKDTAIYDGLAKGRLWFSIIEHHRFSGKVLDSAMT